MLKGGPRYGSHHSQGARARAQTVWELLTHAKDASPSVSRKIKSVSPALLIGVIPVVRETTEERDTVCFLRVTPSGVENDNRSEE